MSRSAMARHFGSGPGSKGSVLLLDIVKVG